MAPGMGKVPRGAASNVGAEVSDVPSLRVGWPATKADGPIGLLAGWPSHVLKVTFVILSTVSNLISEAA